jgi:hypothetical protein
MDLDLLRDPVLGGLDQGQESECGTGLFLVALPKPRMGDPFQYANGQAAAPGSGSSQHRRVVHEVKHSEGK